MRPREIGVVVVVVAFLFAATVAVAPVVAVTVTVPLSVREVSETVNHEALSLAVLVKVPPPVLLMRRYV